MVTNVLVKEKRELIWKRLFAFLFDIFLVVLIVIAIHFLSPYPIPALLSKWVLLISYLTYFVLYEYIQSGTPGKHLMGIKLFHTDKSSSYLLAIFFRNFLKMIFFVEFSWLLYAPYGQGFHNKIARIKIVEQSGDSHQA